MSNPSPFLAVIVSAAAVWASAEQARAPAAAPGAGQVEEIPSNWVPKGIRRVLVTEARASSTFAPEGGQYAPARAIDDDRGTKWVASIAPTVAAPQSITLELLGPQEVTALAVFGERIDNDGIQDAQVLAADPKGGQFTAVATIRDVKSAQWLATFAPVKTSAIRLAITRSGGPSPHTDVYEIEVYGRPLPDAELKRYAAERMEGCASRLKQVEASAERLGLPSRPQLPAIRQAIDAVQSRQRQLADRLARWESLGASERSQLAADIERQEMRLRQFVPTLEQAATAWPGRAGEIAAAREAAGRSASGGKTVSTRDGQMVSLGNDRVSVTLDEAEGTWGATWLGRTDAAVRRVHFALEADQRTLGPKGVRAEVVPCSDAIGPGLEVCQRWGNPIAVERRIRVYDGRPAVVVAAQITNRGGREVKLGPVRMLELSDRDRGWWHLSDLIRAPAAVGFSGASPACRPAPEEEPASTGGTQYGSQELLALASPDAPGGMALGALSARSSSSAVSARFRCGDGGTTLEATLHPRSGTMSPGQTIAFDPVWLSVEDNRYDAFERYGDAVAALASPPVRTGANALWCSWYPIRMGISEEIALAHAEIAARHFKPLGLDVIQLDHGWQQGDVCGDWLPNERFPHGLKWLAEQLRSRHGMKLGLWIAPTQVALTSRLFRDHPEWMLKDAQGKTVTTGRWFWVPNPEMALLDASHPGAEKWIEETFARLSADGATYYKIDFIAGSPALDRAMAAIRRGAGPSAWIRYCQTPALLSAGLASSAYIGADTGDAGLPDWINLARENAPLLAASYWANDRLYHREVCDMSVGVKADVEEARFRLTFMTLSGCSISFSDDFRPLGLPRIRMMQQCLPPGNPAARPLDVFEQKLPSLWHMHCKGGAGEWDAVGVFNFEDQPQERSIAFASLGLPSNAKAAVFEFWEEKFLGLREGRVTLSMAPRTARVLLIRRLADRPQVLATNMHLLGGLHEVPRITWDEKRQVLSGTYRRAPGLKGKVYFWGPDGLRPLHESPLLAGTVRLERVGPNVWSQEVCFREAQLDWAVPFEKSEP
jgi:hypothetical protein